MPDQSVQLTLGGGVSKRFKDYFDLYPIEVSTDLVDWTALTTLQRTNSNTNAFTWTDTQSGTASMRFYRTVTDHLITPVLKPTGPFAVGMISRLLTDSTRRNRYGISTNGSFMVSIWYPAVAEAGRLPGSFEDAPMARDSAWASSWGNAAYVDRLPYVKSPALPDAQGASAQAPYPVLVYSPGRGDARSDLVGRGPDLASHGYMVISIDHADAAGTVFPDGTYLKGDWSTATLAGTQDRIRDVQFVLDQLPRWNEEDPLLAGRFDVEHIATMGFSWGAESAVEAARIDERCKAAILIDEIWSFVPELLSVGLQKPLLAITAEFSDGGLYSKNTRDAVFFKINSISHVQLVDYHWLSTPGDIADGRETARTISDYTLWFLNKYLKGIKDPIPPPEHYRLITNFRQK